MDKRARMIRSGSKQQRLSLAESMVVLILSCWSGGVESQLVKGMFVFGDSLVDVGNNNFLYSFARSNYFPYGIDFDSGPTGRFSNGKTFVDSLGRMLGLAYPPAFIDPCSMGARLLGGVNYASAAAGILEETGRHYGERHSLKQQVENFESTLMELRSIMDATNLTYYLSKSMAVLVFGSNDYINNYLMPPAYSSSFTYTPRQFSKLLIDRYAPQILALYKLGLRKFFICGIGPLGCIPNQRAKGKAAPGKCVDNVNKMARMFNEELKSLVDLLNKRLLASGIFVYGNTFDAVMDIINNPKAFGFISADIGCCGMGKNNGEITCLPFGFPCLNRNKYVFWDAYHPTEAVNDILAQRVVFGSTFYSHPMNVFNMTLY